MVPAQTLPVQHVHHPILAANDRRLLTPEHELGQPHGRRADVALRFVHLCVVPRAERVGGSDASAPGDIEARNGALEYAAVVAVGDGDEEAVGAVAGERMPGLPDPAAARPAGDDGAVGRVHADDPAGDDGAVIAAAAADGAVDDTTYEVKCGT